MTVDIPPVLLERSEAETMWDYAAAVPAPSREALGMASLRIGGGVALAMRNDPTGYWNKTLGIGFDEPVDAEMIGEIVDFYRSHEAPAGVLQLAPAVLPEDWPEICAKFGLREGSKLLKHAATTEAALAAVEAVRLDSGLSVGPVAPDEAAAWAATVVGGMGMPERGFLEMATGSVGRPGWYCFAVRDGAELLAGGALHVFDQVGSLFAASTLPKARGRGAQSALVAARVRAAAELGLRWLVVETFTETPDGNSSLHNVLRLGFETQYERGQWVWSPKGQADDVDRISTSGSGDRMSSLNTTETSAALRALGDAIDGSLYLPGDDGWDEARTPWHLNVDQRPAAVAVPGSAADAVKVVNAARELGLRVAPQATGHNGEALGSLAGSVLVRTTGLRDVTVDPEARVARAAAGAQWRDVSAALAPYGLMGLAGTAPDVSVAGYLLGGGLSWFARSHGLASNHVVAIELVTADGELRRVDAEHEPELFWAVRGGGGNFGLVTAIELRAFELTEVVAGMMFWPIESGREALRAWSEWTATVPEEVTSIARRMTFPPVPQVPDHLRGRTFIVMDAVSQLSEDETAELLAPLRELKPEVDTFGPMPVPALLHLHMDPEEPVPGHGDGLMVGEFTEATIDAVLHAGPELLVVEVRHLGGACSRADGVPGAVAAFEADYHILAGGVAMDEATTTATQRATDQLLAALAPWQRGATYINFRTAVTPGEQLWGAERYRELQVLKALYDPANVMHSNHTIEPSVSPQVV